MKPLLVLLLLSTAMLAQVKTTVTAGVIQDTTGNPATSGYVQFDLQPTSSGLNYSVPGVGAISTTGQCAIDGTGQLPACGVWGTGAIVPANTTYCATYFPNGVQTQRVCQLNITGTSFDLTRPVFAPIATIIPQYNTITTSPIAANIVPAANSVFTLGNAAAHFAQAWIDNVFLSGTLTVGNLVITSITGAQTTTTSSISNNMVQLIRTDNSPPVPNAGILNNWLAPAFRFDLITQGGGVTGAQQVMLLNMPNVKGKEYTTLTQSVTGSGTPQTVSVGDSSIWNLTDRNQAFIDFNHGGSSETVTVTAISDATHITGVFTLSHSTGANARNGFAGYKSVFGALGEDQAGSTNNLNVLNPNIVCVAQTAALCVGLEQDVTNSTGVRPALYYGEDSTHRYIVGEEIGIYNGDITAGMVVDSGDGTHAANNGYLCISCGKNNAIAIASSGSVHAANGITIRDSTNNGIIIGSHQTPPDNPAWGGTDPTHGIYLTAKGTSGTISSNDITFEALNASVASTMGIVYSAIGGGTYFTLNSAIPSPTTNPFIGADYTINTPIAFFLRDTGTAQAVASFRSDANVGSLKPENGHVLNVDATTLAIGGGTALATSNQTGTGSLVLATNPVLVTPNIGAATTASQITSTLVTGTSPLAVNSTTVNTNLNADLLDGVHAGSVSAGHAMCWKDATHMGYCSTVVDASGLCNCN